MAQTIEGALKASAKRAGLSVGDFLTKTEAGLKRCSKCKNWKRSAIDFGVDNSRFDGRNTKCITCSRVAVKKDLKGRPSPLKGRKITGQARLNIIAARIGNKSRTGQKATAAERAKISETRKKTAPRGPDHYAWKGGKGSDRDTPEYREWRSQVFKRDRFTCQDCGDASGGNLNAHHIKPYATYPALRLVVGNGVTLCERCHTRRHYKADSARNRRKARRESNR